jgi:hypothetical protein
VYTQTGVHTPVEWLDRDRTDVCVQVFATWLAWQLFFMLNLRIGPVRTTTINQCKGPTAVLLGALFIGEWEGTSWLTRVFIVVGGCLTITGVLLAQQEPKIQPSTSTGEGEEGDEDGEVGSTEKPPLPKEVDVCSDVDVDVDVNGTRAVHTDADVVSVPITDAVVEKEDDLHVETETGKDGMESEEGVKRPLWVWYATLTASVLLMSTGGPCFALMSVRVVWCGVV